MEERKRLIPPRELKTLEIDVEKKIFRINGEDFGKGCTGFSIWCDPCGKSGNYINIRMDIDTSVQYTSHYDWSGNQTAVEERHTKEPAANQE